MKAKAKIKKKFLATRPKYSQMELRAMDRKRTPRPVTPMTARIKRKQEFWDFAKEEKKKAKTMDKKAIPIN